MPAVALRNALWRENQELCDEFIYCSIQGLARSVASVSLPFACNVKLAGCIVTLSYKNDSYERELSHTCMAQSARQSAKHCHNNIGAKCMPFRCLSPLQDVICSRQKT